MTDLTTSIQDAIVRGDWATVVRDATLWMQSLQRTAKRDPRPAFALNVVHLIRGEFAAAWKVHAQFLQEGEDLTKVREWVEAMAAARTEDGHIQLVLGLFLAQGGQSEQSVEHYKKAAQLAPKSPYPHFFLAQIHERADRPEMAIKSYREAVKLDPAYIAARTNLGVAYQGQDNLEMAIPQFREVLKLTPNDANAHANLACALAEQGKQEPALKEYQEALRLNPDDAEIHFALGGLYETRNRMDLALKEYEAAIQVKP
ncbi:MAG: tetratricopeptide repeat protein, partial [Nitrospira sp.]